ncbi:MAG: hypothetical protein ACLSAC_13545 [Enterocloster bolteae]
MMCIGILFLVLGAAALGPVFCGQEQRAMVMYLEPGYTDLYAGILLAGPVGPGSRAGVISIMQQCEVPDEIRSLRKKRRIYETDERNRMLGLRCWAIYGIYHDAYRFISASWSAGSSA